MLAALLSPAFLRQAAPFLLLPWSPRAASPYRVAVEPGNASVARGSDLEVVARLSGFDAATVELARKAGGEAWSRQPMIRDQGAHRFLLLDLRAATLYFVEAEGVRSPVFRVEVADLPYVKSIDLEYLFPAYTALAPRRVEEARDVAALRGTQVALRITPTLRVASGRLVIEGAPAVPLAAGPDGRLAGEFTVSRPGFYRIELPASDGRLRKATPT